MDSQQPSEGSPHRVKVGGILPQGGLKAWPSASEYAGGSERKITLGVQVPADSEDAGQALLNAAVADSGSIALWRGRPWRERLFSWPWRPWVKRELIAEKMRVTRAEMAEGPEGPEVSFTMQQEP